MKSLCGTILAAAFAALALFAVPAAHATIRYTISLKHQEQHLFHVTMEVPVEGRELQTAFPAWNALYQIRDFAERVRDVTAVCASATNVPLNVEKLDKQDWRIRALTQCRPGDHNTFDVSYDVLWNDPGPFDSQLDAHHAFVNPAEVLMYVPGHRSEDAAVKIADLPSGWQSATALPMRGDHGEFYAPNYDALVDAPIEIGELTRVRFQTDGASIEVALDAKSANYDRLEPNLLKIVHYELQLMGGSPFEKHEYLPDYLFIIHIGPGGEVGGGGMEHSNSCAIAASSVEEASEIAAHEFFHAWNVKRIRPEALEPVDYAREQYTRSLWFAEGVTNTYEDFALVRSGFWTSDQFYHEIAGQIDALQARPARAWQSAEESSMDAWFEGFPDYNDPARSISYYNKGEILGLLLDLAIRDATDNRKSLDDVMRFMNEKYAKAGKFYSESGGIESAVEEVAGKSFKEFFQHYVAGTEEIPYDDFLRVAGWQLDRSPNRDAAPYRIVELPHPTERQAHIREGILHGTTN